MDYQKIYTNIVYLLVITQNKEIQITLMLNHFDDRESALVYASEILGLKRRHVLYEFEITKQLNESKILKLHKLESEFLQYKTEKLDLINNIKIVSSGKHPVLESKTISELMRIYYGAIGSQCPRCESELQTPIFNTIYRNNAS